MSGTVDGRHRVSVGAGEEAGDSTSLQGSRLRDAVGTLTSAKRKITRHFKKKWRGKIKLSTTVSVVAALVARAYVSACPSLPVCSRACSTVDSVRVAVFIGQTKTESERERERE